MGAVGYAVSATTCPAQTMVSTDPVGVVSTELPATGYTYLGVNLTTPTLLTSSDTELTGANVDIGIDLSSLETGTQYVMEITSGAYEGFSADIDSWAGQVLTLKEDIEVGGVIPGTFDGSRIVIKVLPTIGSIFGEDNAIGLKSGSISNADVIFLFSAGSFEQYFYFPGGLGQTAEWRDSNGNRSNDVPIHFGDGVLIDTRDTAPKTISISGTVKLGPTNVPMYEGFNLISNPSPVEGSQTLANSGLKDGLRAGGPTSADIVYLPKAGGEFDRYFYFPGGLGQTAEWRNVDTGDNADGILLPNSGSFFVERKSGDTSVTFKEDLPNN